MKTLKYKIIGNAALLMHSDVTANPLHPLTKKLKELTKKRNKTDEDLWEIAKVEFEAGLYWSKDTGYIMPSAVLDAAFLGSAKHFKQGVLWKQACLITDDSKFIFKHRSLEPSELFKLPQYIDMRTVKVGTSKTTRCRPVFREWEFETEIHLDEAKMNEGEIDSIVKNAGLYVGLCDWRPKFGRFDVTKL
jgi:hypothetical protein